MNREMVRGSLVSEIVNCWVYQNGIDKFDPTGLLTSDWNDRGNKGKWGNWPEESLQVFQKNVMVSEAEINYCKGGSISLDQLNHLKKGESNKILCALGSQEVLIIANEKGKVRGLRLKTNTEIISKE